MDQYAEEKRTEKNLIVRKQLIIKDCARRFILKVYRHEALRGLFATAELLVLIVFCCGYISSVLKENSDFKPGQMEPS